MVHRRVNKIATAYPYKISKIFPPADWSMDHQLLFMDLLFIPKYLQHTLRSLLFGIGPFCKLAIFIFFYNDMLG